MPLAVAVKKRTVQQVSHHLKAGMRMRRYAHIVCWLQVIRLHVVYQQEGVQLFEIARRQYILYFEDAYFFVCGSVCMRHRSCCHTNSFFVLIVLTDSMFKRQLVCHVVFTGVSAYLAE